MYEYYSAMKKKKILAFATFVDHKGSMRNEISQRETNIV